MSHLGAATQHAVDTLSRPEALRYIDVMDRVLGAATDTPTAVTLLAHLAASSTTTELHHAIRAAAAALAHDWAEDVKWEALTADLAALPTVDEPDDQG